MKRLLTLMTTLALLTGVLAGCNGGTAASPSPSAAPSPTESAQPTGGDRPAVNLALLVGPTGVGAAKLMADNDAGTTANAYNVTLPATNDEIVAKLTSGEADIAAVATNLAATLYNKSDGLVQIAAVNTLGVLHILERGDTIHSMADLKGRTIYASGQAANPEYVLNYLLKENGLDPAKDVKIVWKTTDEVSSMMLAGTADVCMLPVPAATAVLVKDAAAGGKLRAALDLSEEWDKTAPQGQLTMGCVVVRTALAQEHHDAVNAVLKEYADCIAHVRDNPADAATLVAQYGITPSAAIAEQAIPQCNLVCITGRDARDSMQDYYEVLYNANPASIGGSNPDDAFYYMP